MGIFDPLGQVGPYTLLGKKLNQELCAAKFDWNTDFPEDIEDRVVKWFEGMKALELLPMPRSFGLSYHGQPVILITFTDASLIGMGAVSYFVIEATGAIVWVAAKSRVSPMKETNVDVNGSIPRLELAAAVIGVELSTQIKEDIDVQITREVFFTDSTTVYFWIQGKDGKHPVFVANRFE